LRPNVPSCDNDRKLKHWSVENFIEMLRNDVEYSLRLRTRDASYERGRPVFEGVVNSFVFTRE
jgi:hypothetical protein